MRSFCASSTTTRRWRKASSSFFIFYYIKWIFLFSLSFALLFLFFILSKMYVKGRAEKFSRLSLSFSLLFLTRNARFARTETRSRDDAGKKIGVGCAWEKSRSGPRVVLSLSSVFLFLWGKKKKCVKDMTSSSLFRVFRKIRPSSGEAFDRHARFLLTRKKRF
jgi:hypothetical protein